METDSEVVVAVGNPDHVEQLVRTAGDLARVRDGGIRLVSVVVKSRDSPFEMFSDETIRQEYSGDEKALLERATAAAPGDVPVEADLVVARSVASGVLEAVSDPAVEALVVGWHGPPRRSELVLGTSVDKLLQRAPCDAYVERIGRIANGVEGVLLPVAGGPHVRPAAAAARAIATANDATVSAVTVVPPGTDEAAADRRLTAAVEELSAAPGPDVSVETAIRESNDVEAALLETAAEHDVVVFGATRQSGLRDRLVGSVPRRVADRTDRTVILARAAAATGPLRSLVGRLDARRRGA